MLESITIQSGRPGQPGCQPGCGGWAGMLASPPRGAFLGRTQDEWRGLTRRELGLDASRPIVATGHQTLLWHPGILAKYLALESYARRDGIARANLIVDQHAGPFGQFAVPIRRSDGSLHTREITLTAHRRDVPMALHEAFEPNPKPEGFASTWPFIDAGIDRIIDSVRAHRDAPNAAIQMGLALADLMAPWVSPMPHVTATQLQQTTLCRSLVQAMVEDPHGCIAAYNRAVAAVPEGGVSSLRVSHDYVELPLWRLGADGRRVRAFDHDAEGWLDEPASSTSMLPRALLMTALIRLGMCDLFIHGTGGALYDRAMELWLNDWLGVHPAPVAVATATVRLDLDEPGEPAGEPADDVASIQREIRRLWHDPSRLDGGGPSEAKQELLAAVDDAPYGSSERRAAFFEMHRQLERDRADRQAALDEARSRLERAARRLADAKITSRRDWAFPLYPRESIDELAAAIEDRIAADFAAIGTSDAS